MYDLKAMIYNHSPIYFQNLFTSMEGIKVKKYKYGPIYSELLNELTVKNSRELDNEYHIQQNELQKLIKHSYENSPFYKEFYKGIDLSPIRTIADLSKLPILEKEFVRQYIKLMHAVEESSAAAFQTIDSEGAPLKFLWTREDVQKRMAFIDFFKMQHGAITSGMKQATFSPHRFIPGNQQKKIFWRDSFAENQRYYSNHYCTEENASSYIKNLNEFQPDSINGRLPIIHGLAVYINNNQIKLSFTPVAVFLTDETVDPLQKKEIEKAFNCPVRNHFAASQDLPLIAECAKGNLHYHPRSGVIETAEDGEMIVTNFTSYGTPLIRYRTGEYIELESDKIKCTCGSIHPVVTKKKEPHTIYLRTKNKAIVKAPYVEDLCKEFAECINKIQFIQNGREAIDVFIEAKENYTNAVTENIYEGLQSTFGQDMKFNIRIVEQMPQRPHQSFQLVINNLSI